jgi:ATP-dependent protease ClpP protease subunit
MTNEVSPIETMFTKCSGLKHELYLTGEIKSPEHYVDWFNLLRSADEHDTIVIYINSYGGSVATAIQMVRVMKDCRAEIICSTEGECMSAATMIFLHGDILMVSDYSIFMFHNYSGGTVGKGGEMYNQIVHEKAWSENMLRGIYKDFLTPEEINGLLLNNDIWMDSTEVMSRMQTLAEIRVGLQPSLEAPTPKPKRKSKKK